MVAEVAASSLDGAAGTVELVSRVGRLVPLRIVQRYFGFPGPDDATMLRWSRATQADMFRNPTNDPALRSWVNVPAGSPFPIQNLPFGAFDTPAGEAHTGVAIGDKVLDLTALAASGKLTESVLGHFRGGELNGDLLPLVLAVVDAVDTMPGALPQPLRGKAKTAPEVPAYYTGLAALSAWILYVTSLGAVVLSLGYFTVAAMSFGLVAGLAGLALGAWGTRRFMWARWLAKQNWGNASPLPAWPISPEEPGIKPYWFELLIDCLVVFFVSMGAFGEGVVRVLSLSSLPVLAIAVLCSAAAVYEAWQRE